MLSRFHPILERNGRTYGQPGGQANFLYHIARQYADAQQYNDKLEVHSVEWITSYNGVSTLQNHASLLRRAPNTST